MCDNAYNWTCNFCSFFDNSLLMCLFVQWKAEPIQAARLDSRKSPRGRRDIPIYYGSGVT